ncbi:MAG: efflux RND transporter periplasmic adaptor subunit [Paracoccaceae bacterium]
MSRLTSILISAALFAAASWPALADLSTPVAVVAYASTAQPFTETLVLRGRTEANRRVDVKSETSGLVSSPPLRKGAFVRAGETLCQIENGDRTAELSGARSRLTEAKQNFEAADQLAKKGFTSETRANAMVAELEQARARVFRAELDISRLTVAAPFDGLLETDTAELGSLLQNGTTCASLIALDPIKLIAYAPERSVDQLKVGAEVAARLITGREITGRITFVSRAADRDTRTYLMEAEAPNADMTIRDGMTTEIDVSLEARLAHLTPQTALTLDNDGALGVRLSVNGVARFTPVTVLRDEPRGVWLDGLPQEAEIIVVGQEFVIDGQALKVDYLNREPTQ